MTPPPREKKRRVVALVLCVLLGVTGAHHFYVGRNGTGALYLLTAGFLGLGVLADTVALARGRFRDAWERKLV